VKTKLKPAYFFSSGSSFILAQEVFFSQKEVICLIYSTFSDSITE
jgi:hypothetical protein